MTEKEFQNVKPGDILYVFSGYERIIDIDITRWTVKRLVSYNEMYVSFCGFNKDANKKSYVTLITKIKTSNIHTNHTQALIHAKGILNKVTSESQKDVANGLPDASNEIKIAYEHIAPSARERLVFERIQDENQTEKSNHQ